jgi:hypothetical protein
MRGSDIRDSVFLEVQELRVQPLRASGVRDFVSLEGWTLEIEFSLRFKN